MIVYSLLSLLITVVSRSHLFSPILEFLGFCVFACSMEESTTESTAANTDTLKVELKKLLTETLSNGGGETESDGSSGVLKAIDEAIRLLNRLREVESKKPESDIPSSSSSESPKVEVPKEFKCILSNAIMIDPVTIASGNVWFYSLSLI